MQKNNFNATGNFSAEFKSNLWFDQYARVGKMQILIRINIRILHVVTSADPHIRIIPPAEADEQLRLWCICPCVCVLPCCWTRSFTVDLHKPQSWRMLSKWYCFSFPQQSYVQKQWCHTLLERGSLLLLSWHWWWCVIVVSSGFTRPASDRIAGKVAVQRMR